MLPAGTTPPPLPAAARPPPREVHNHSHRRHEDSNLSSPSIGTPLGVNWIAASILISSSPAPPRPAAPGVPPPAAAKLPTISIRGSISSPHTTKPTMPSLPPKCLNITKPPHPPSSTPIMESLFRDPAPPAAPRCRAAAGPKAGIKPQDTTISQRTNPRHLTLQSLRSLQFWCSIHPPYI